MLRWINSNLNKTQHPQPNAEIQFETQNTPGKILDLQFQCQSQSATKQLITQLTSLYTQAVEYYESNNDQKYRIYQKRMENFLKKQNIDDILRGKSGHLVSKKDTAEKQITHAITKSKNQVNKLLNKSQKLKHLNQGLMLSSLKQQQNNLSQRIERRKAMSNRSSRTREDEDNEQRKNDNKKINTNLVFDSFNERKWQNKKKIFI